MRVQNYIEKYRALLSLQRARRCLCKSSEYFLEQKLHEFVATSFHVENCSMAVDLNLKLVEGSARVVEVCCSGETVHPFQLVEIESKLTLYKANAAVCLKRFVTCHKQLHNAVSI